LNFQGQMEPRGNVNDQGLIRCLLALNIDCSPILAYRGQHILFEVPFSSWRKRAAVCIRHPDDPNLVRLFCKGEPKTMVQHVNRMFDKSGQIVPIDQETRDFMLADK